MKRVLFLTAVMFAAMTVSAKTYSYKCGVTAVAFEDQSYSGKNIFKVTIQHTGKNTSDYSSSTTYDATVTFFLTSEDGTLDGTYTTEGFVSIGSTYDKDYINFDNTKVKVVGYNERSLHPDYVSKLVINKEAGENQYSIGECTFYATNSKYTKDNTYIYHYCYDVDDLQNPDVALKPFVFGVDTEFHTEINEYDMTVTGVDVIRDDTDYDAIRYFMTLTCTGKHRTTGNVRNFEVQLAIYPSSASIVGTFATNDNTVNLMYYDHSYVRDLKESKTRYLAKDSANYIQIKSKGDNQYSFYGGTLICTDMDMNYWQVYQKKRIEAVHYYHFSDNDGEGIEFGFDESNKSMDLTASNVAVTEIVDGFDITVTATNENGVSYLIYITTEGASIAATHKFNETLSAWTKVSHGTNESYAASGSVVYIIQKSGNTYTISGNLLCENEYTYNLAPFDFQYNKTTTDIDAFVGDQPLRKVMMNGVLYLEKNGKLYNLQGAAVK